MSSYIGSATEADAVEAPEAIARRIRETALALNLHMDAAQRAGLVVAATVSTSPAALERSPVVTVIVARPI